MIVMATRVNASSVGTERGYHNSQDANSVKTIKASLPGTGEVLKSGPTSKKIFQFKVASVDFQKWS